MELAKKPALAVHDVKGFGWLSIKIISSYLWRSGKMWRSKREMAEQGKTDALYLLLQVIAMRRMELGGWSAALESAALPA